MKRRDERDHLLGGAKKAADSSSDKATTFRGARPKVRSPKEVQRRRILMKKAKNLSQGGMLLESVTETDKNGGDEDRSAGSKKKKSDPRRQVLPSAGEEKNERGGAEKKNTADEGNAERSCKELFGVKSYLHNFYDAFTVRGLDESEDDSYLYLIGPQKRPRSAICWKASICLGAILLLFGLIVLLVGYLAAKRPVIVGHQQDMEIVDRTALTFDRNLDLCKVVGIVLFCLGGVVLTTVLLLPVLLNRYCDDGEGGGAAAATEAFKVASAHPDELTPPQTPTEKKVPATEELKTVQPKRGENDEVVMTHAGLCRVP